MPINASVTVALNYEEIWKNSQKISNIKPSIERINYQSVKNDCKTFEKNDSTIAVNVLYVQ